jgi:hypothetical protein
VTIDGMDGRLESAFGAFPSHAFVIDATGRVAVATPLDEGSLQPAARSRERSRPLSADPERSQHAL